ncbi:hypothetical protein OKS35_03730 [Exiguobacterium sp. N5]|uniref:hypothetical protein n=1 Tax=Exiguobacterium sp. N5 TaxID=2990450 RepID=UPI0021F4F5DC|nr:hypothetical protein [Exiguobacterium sp. N5]MCV9899228.1 hypothetical protein [Exiguobacterium sp. N5]
MNLKHILIVGGTGMLAEPTSYLAIEQDVTIIGRDKKKWQASYNEILKRVIH